jgi:hypothetical protein
MTSFLEEERRDTKVSVILIIKIVCLEVGRLLIRSIYCFHLLQMVRMIRICLLLVWVGLEMSSTVEGRELRTNAFQRRKSPTASSLIDVSGRFSTFRGAKLEGLSRFFRWRTLIDKNGTRTDEAHTSFMTPMRRPYVLSRLEMEGCIRCLKEEGGLSYWVPFLEGGKPWFVILRCITRKVIQDAWPYKLEQMVHMSAEILVS